MTSPRLQLQSPSLKKSRTRRNKKKLRTKLTKKQRTKVRDPQSAGCEAKLTRRDTRTCAMPETSPVSDASKKTGPMDTNAKEEPRKLQK